MPEARPAAGRRRPANRRQVILDAAIALANERGMGNVALADVARQVGVTPAALYRHIGTKDALPAAIAAAVLDDVAVALEAAPADARGVAAALLGLGQRDPARLGAFLAIDPSHLATPVADGAGVGAANARVTDCLAAVATVGGPVVAVRLRALLAGAHALALLGGTESVSDRSLVVGRLAAVLARPAASAVDETPAPVSIGAPARTKLLHTALSLFRARGYRGVGVDEIGAAAGLSGPSLYRYFEQKTDLLVEASDRSTIAVLEAVERVLATTSDARAAAATLADEYAAIAVHHADLIVVTAREEGNVPEDARRLHQQRRRAVADAWTELIAQIDDRLTRRAQRALVGAGMAAARSTAVAASTVGMADHVAVAEAGQTVRALTLGG